MSLSDEHAQYDVTSLRLRDAPPRADSDEHCDADSIADAQLMSRLARGDMNALAALVRRHQNGVRSLAYRFSGRWELADDIAQDAFIRVYHSAPRYQPTAAFSTWLYRIVVNLCFDQHKRRRVRLADVGAAPPLVESAERPLEQRELADAVQQAVMELPERQRMAVLLHRFDGLTHDQIAATTGWSRSAVESLLVRAYQELRSKLRKWQ